MPYQSPVTDTILFPPEDETGWALNQYGVETLGSGFHSCPAKDTAGLLSMVGRREMGPWKGAPLTLYHQ